MTSDFEAETEKSLRQCLQTPKEKFYGQANFPSKLYAS